MARKQNGNLKSAFFMFMTVVLIVSMWKIGSAHPEGAWEWWKEKSQEVVEKIKDWGKKADQEINQPSPPKNATTNPNSTPKPTNTPTSIPTNLLHDLPTTPPNIPTPTYDRTQWSHWNKTGCWDVRKETLHTHAQPDTLKLLDKNKKPTTNKATACTIDTGTWLDPYDNKTLTDPTKIDIDHIIPLSYAHQNNGHALTPTQKQAFANDPDNLLPTSASNNRSKGDKGPSKWKPPANSAHCVYAQKWVNVTTKYELTVQPQDKQELSKMLATCK